MRLSSKTRINSYTSIAAKPIAGIVLSAIAAFAPLAMAQQPTQFTTGALTELKPLGAPSAVDQFRRGATTPSLTETTWQPEPKSVRHAVRMQSATQSFGASQTAGNIRQVAAMQPQGGFALPDSPATQSLPVPGTVPDTINGPPAVNSSPPMASPQASIPDTAPYATTGPRLPSPTAGATGSQNAFQSSPSDLQPMSAPALGDGLARVENCNQVTAPSAYYLTSSRYGGGCGNVYPTTYTTPTTYTAPIAGPVTTSVPPGALPPEIPPVGSVFPPATPPAVAATPAAAPARALISFGQENYAVQVGQGLWGQPVAYVPGQGLRNWLRYMSF